jgi:hypothetical protein
MIMNRIFLTTTVVCAYFVFLTGCPSTPAPTAGGTTTTGGEHGHDHGHEGHDHGHEEGPHKGHIIELGGGEYHAELVHSDADHEVTVYLLDESLKKPVTTKAADLTINVVIEGKAESFKLPAAPQDGETEGASKFSTADEKLCELLHGEVKGRMNVTIADKPYTGELAHEHHDHAAHAEHDHK